MSRPNDQFAVYAESDPYIGSCGESATACKHKFIPAFRDDKDGRVELARMSDGRPAAMHLISALPKEWAISCDELGNVLELIESVVAGFVRGEQFYTRDEATKAV